MTRSLHRQKEMHWYKIGFRMYFKISYFDHLILVICIFSCPELDSYDEHIMKSCAFWIEGVTMVSIQSDC